MDNLTELTLGELEELFGLFARYHICPDEVISQFWNDFSQDQALICNNMQ